MPESRERPIVPGSIKDHCDSAAGLDRHFRPDPPRPDPQGSLPGEAIRFDAIADALAAIRNGDSIVVVDDENRENEGDLICAAQFATPEQINFMATEARGLICLAMEGERLDALDCR